MFIFSNLKWTLKRAFRYFYSDSILVIPVKNPPAFRNYLYLCPSLNMIFISTRNCETRQYKLTQFSSSIKKSNFPLPLPNLPVQRNMCASIFLRLLMLNHQSNPSTHFTGLVSSPFRPLPSFLLQTYILELLSLVSLLSAQPPFSLKPNTAVFFHLNPPLPR